jgi:hypothetical protein
VKKIYPSPIRDLKVKVKFSLQTPWRHMGNEGTASFIFNLSIRWRWVVSFTTCLPFPSTRSLWYLPNRKPGGYLNQPGCFGQEINLFPCHKLNYTFSCPGHSLVNILTELPQLVTVLSYIICRVILSSFCKTIPLPYWWYSLPYVTQLMGGGLRPTALHPT